MRLGDHLKLARGSLLKHPLRSLLTMLGMIIGVASVIAMVSIGLGARHQVGMEIARLGTNLLIVQSNRNATARPGQGSAENRLLSEQDALALASEIEQVKYAVPVVNGGVRLVFNNRNWNTSLVGTRSSYVPARDWSVSLGRNITAAEVGTTAKVALIGRTVARKLSPEHQVLGKIIRVQNVPFRVVGVLAEKGYSAIGRDQDDVIIVPITTAKTRLLGGYYQVHRDAVNYLLIKGSDQQGLHLIKEKAERVLRARHGISAGQKSDFNLRDPMAALSAKKAASETMTFLLACVAIASLVVGGISIMNIMLVSVVERTREIGIRIAIGAGRWDIQAQFLAESAGMAAIGGTIGIVVGIVLAYTVRYSMGWPVYVEAWVVAGTLVFSSTVGILSGLYPAIKASRLDPVEAIRCE